MRFISPRISRKAAGLAIIMIALVVIHQSCQHEPFEPTTVTIHVSPTEDQPVDTSSNDTTPTPNPPVVTGCSEDTVYFQRDIDPLFFAKCGSSGGCHSTDSAFGNLVLSTLDTTLNSGVIVPYDAHASRLYQRITATDPSKRMPPPGAGSLSAMEMHKIYRWIEDGAKDCDDCDTTNVSYALTVRPIMEFYQCTDCHSGGSVNFSDYAGVKEEATNGNLYGVISHQQNYKPMPDGQPKMDSCHIAKIKAWIDAGAENN